MSEAVGLDFLATEIESRQLRIAISVVAVGLLLFVSLSYRRLQTQISARSRPLYGDLASATLLVGTYAIALAVVLGVWELTGTVWSVFTEHDLNEDLLPNAIASFVLVIGTSIVTRFVRRLIDELLGSASAVTAHQREITHRIAQVVIWSVAIVVVLGVWIDDLSGLLVGAGFLGIVVGMAARQTLGTVLSGFVLMFSRPFEIGDWVAVEDEEGIVTDISIVNTRIQSFDGEYVMIPNDVISSSTITNRSKRGRLRVEIDVGVDYDADIDRATTLLEDVLAELEYALDTPAPDVVSKEFGDSAVVLGARFWIDKPRSQWRWQARTAAINAIKREFDSEGVDIPYPQRALSSRGETDVRIDGRTESVDEETDASSAADGDPEPEDGNRGGREYRMSHPEDN
ncbi:mechanosensitive ion channel family protein [Natronobacterium gregoryi]|uniref:Mechanosensitive ion channel family protein n=2 Tax=Natronobacterium gregoryi TaxID=44930 RepID=L0AIQ3_NATGS|nr:mechanosensitive ion channel family protein [Natronobacterium gregoryi]AFZ73324.1 small-conductance mechanosensitive channel [Natronobacterium gregoryi SP2]ELY73887.1 mechanosensitive ion channel protein MscS [Natronobacterium gregoryi SP2]PLK19886.1 mechanosensitive ion channel family protein [Natronobacterium gregoryi SP2]SFJ37366.1 Small-conductance mechanosensitive channel [Natronobacterium gregoryi]